MQKRAAEPLQPQISITPSDPLNQLLPTSFAYGVALFEFLAAMPAFPMTKA